MKFWDAAAVIAAEREPASIDFLTLDERLLDAASKEGFRVNALST